MSELFNKNKELKSFEEALSIEKLNTKGSVYLNSANQSLNLRGISIEAGKDITLLSAKDIDLGPRIISKDFGYRYWIGSQGISWTENKDTLWMYNSPNFAAIDDAYKGGHKNTSAEITSAIDPFEFWISTELIDKISSKVKAGGELLVQSGRDLSGQSATLSSNGHTLLFSGRDITFNSFPYSTAPNPIGYDWEQRGYQLGSNLIGKKKLTLIANNTLTTQGSSLQSKGDINITSGGNIRFESSRNGIHKITRNSSLTNITHKSTAIDSVGDLNIVTNGSLLFQATKLNSGGKLNVAAKGGYLYAQAQEEVLDETNTNSKTSWGGFGKTKTSTQNRHDVTNKVTEFKSIGDINLLSRDDSTYEASKIETNKNAKLTSTHGKVNFKAVKNTSFEQTITQSKGFFIKNGNSGHRAEAWVLPSVHIGEKLTIDAANGINADIKTQKGQSLQAVLTVLGNTPETAWLKGLSQRRDVHWNEVQDAYKSWNYESQHLNPAVSAVIAIAVAAVTAGAGVTIAAANAAAGTASGAAAAAGASAATAATVSTATYGAVSAGIASLASTAAVSLINNQGNVSKTLKEMGSSQTVKSIVTSMAVGGALAGFDKFMGVEKAANGATKAPLLSNQEWSKVAQRVAGQSVISSSLNTAINGGSFKDNFTTALLANAGNQINAEGANLVGDYGVELGLPGKAISHAAISALSAHIGGGDARGAAAGALAAELGKMTLYKTFDDPAQILAGGKIIGGIAGAFATNSAEGVNSGANASEIVLEHNFFQHELIELDKKITAAKKKGEDIAPIIAEERNKLATERESLKNECQAKPTLCAHNLRYYANDALEPVDSFIGRLYFEPEVIAFTFDESAKDHAVIDKYTNGLGQALEYGLVAAKSLGGEDTRFSITGKSIRTGIHNSQEKQPGFSPTKPTVVVINSGKTGAWEKQLNKPQPNTIYHVDGNKTFQTDSLSRTIIAEGSLSLSKNDRNTYQQSKTGKSGNPGDEGGHLFASIFNGPGEKINILPMNGNLNKSEWKKMENSWAKDLKDGKQIDVKIVPVYKGESKRPESFNVTYSIDGGRPIVKDFSNAPGSGEK
ncbi:hemagglutinin [Xenorhabdus eapokensis]|uniref:Hemagglutinin n=2 Tax=Xenorhabdus eapokensis TaxID=1873482 RepID=A0A1Q5TPB7_9GAMM|nr:hemagglutinin [Xenorhabdus eapokensis]